MKIVSRGTFSGVLHVKRYPEVKQMSLSIGAINARLRRMAAKYGTDFGAYARQAEIIARNFEYHWTASGVVQINVGKGANKNLNPFQKNALEDLRKAPSLKTLQEEARKSLKEENKPTNPKELEKRIRQKDYIERHRDDIAYISDQIKQGAKVSENAMKLYDRLSGRDDAIGYDELYEIVHNAFGGK